MLIKDAVGNDGISLVQRKAMLEKNVCADISTKGWRGEERRTSCYPWRLCKFT